MFARWWAFETIRSMWEEGDRSLVMVMPRSRYEVTVGNAVLLMLNCLYCSSVRATWVHACGSRTIVPWTIRTLDYSYYRWTIRTLDCSYHGLFVPSLDFSYPGLFVPWTVRTLLDCSYRGLFVPWTVRTMDCTYHGLFLPTLDNSYHVEKGNIVCTVWVKKSPLRFSGIFFQNGWEFSVQILQAYYTFIPTVDYKFLFNYLQHWRTYTILGATTQRAFLPMVDISMVVALYMAQLCQSCR